MHEDICRVLLENGTRFLYATNRAVERTLNTLQKEFEPFHYEVSINEKVAYELALAAAYASQRTAFLVSSEGFYEALDPIMSSAYTGVAGGFVIVCVQENEEEVTPIGPFAKLPVIVSESTDEFRSAVEYGYMISEKYQTPVIIQTLPFEEYRESEVGSRQSNKRASSIQHPSAPNSELRTPNSKWASAHFDKNPNRWAATPKFRYQLHRKLNERIEEIREEFENYRGNVINLKGKTGVITDRLSRLEFYDEDWSILKLATIYPLPDKLVRGFVEKIDEVFVEETYPVIEYQVADRSKVQTDRIRDTYKREKPEETMYGFQVVRDRLGSASSINMAHGIKKPGSEKKVLAITYEDFFFHSGMPAFVNVLYNDSSFVLLVMTNQREKELKNILKGFGFENYHHLDTISEIEKYKDADRLTVLFAKGII